MALNKKIIIATGGTGGHIFPSLSLADFLKNKFKIEIITDKRGLKFVENTDEINIKIISSDTIFKKNIMNIFYGVLKNIFSFINCLLLMIKERPVMVIGMGGYSSFPTCIAAFCLRIPILIYENNLVLGRANKFLLPFANKILVSTENIQGIKEKFNNKIVRCGYLIRRNFLESVIEEKSNSSEDIFSILIMGGSQSAKIFGEIIPDILVKLANKVNKLRIYQQCLDHQISKIEKKYDKAKIEFELFPFSKDMYKFLKKTDLVISRSGASSLSELVNLRIPFIAIPLPSSIDNHQFENANYFKKKGYCLLLEERYLQNQLFEILIDLKNNQNVLFLMKKKMREHSDKETCSKIQKLIESILNV